MKAVRPALTQMRSLTFTLRSVVSHSTSGGRKVRKKERLIVHGAVRCSRNSFTLVWLPSGFLANGHLPRMSRPSANYKGDNEVKPGAVHRSTGICFTAEDNPGKSQLGDPLIKAARPVIASNGVPFLHMRSVGSYSTLGREKVGRNKGLLSRKPWAAVKKALC
jgi:hypothetical protein